MLAHRAKDGRTSLPGPWIGKQYHVLGMCVRSFPDYMILMCNTGYAVIMQGITLTFSCILTLNQDTNNWLDCMEFSSGLIKARKWGLVDFIKVSSGQINLVI